MKIIIIISILLLINSCNNIPLNKEKLIDKPIHISITGISTNKSITKMNEIYEKYSETNIVGYEKTEYGEVATNKYGEYIIEDWNIYYNLLLEVLKNSNTNVIYKFGRNQKYSQRFYDNFYFFEIYQIYECFFYV